MSHLRDGLPDPRKPANSQAHTGLNKRLTRQLKIYKLEDPPFQREKSIPLGIVHSILVEAEVEANGEQVGDVVGSDVGGGSCPGILDS